MKIFSMFLLCLMFSTTSVVATPELSIGERVSTFLNAVKSEKTYVHSSQLVFDEDDVYFLSEAGVLESVSLVGRDQNGLYVSGFNGIGSNFSKDGPKRCSKCNNLLYDGNCTNQNCSNYFLNY